MAKYETLPMSKDQRKLSAAARKELQGCQRDLISGRVGENPIYKIRQTQTCGALLASLKESVLNTVRRWDRRLMSSMQSVCLLPKDSGMSTGNELLVIIQPSHEDGTGSLRVLPKGSDTELICPAGDVCFVPKFWIVEANLEDTYVISWSFNRAV